MKITILKCIKQVEDGYIVRFDSHYGVAEGKWVGTEPKLNSEYYIEIDIPGLLEWGNQVIPIKENISQITSSKNRIYLSGILESVFDDGFAVLKIGDNIVAFELTGENYTTGTYVRIETDSISLFDINL
jgi:hypothetical protein